MTACTYPSLGCAQTWSIRRKVGRIPTSSIYAFSLLNVDLLHKCRSIEATPAQDPTTAATMKTPTFPKIYNVYFLAMIATVGGML